MEVYKEYEYIKDGKTIRIKRSYKIKGTRAKKQSELDEYFKNNAEDIRTSKKLTEVLVDYNQTHKHKICYSTLLNKYHSLFGMRRGNNKQEISEEEEEKQCEKQDSN